MATIGEQRLVILPSPVGPNVQSHDFVTSISPPIYLDPNGKYDLALFSGSMWYTWFNISSKLGNNKIKFLYQLIPATFTIPDGLYDINTLNEAFRVGMKSCDTTLIKYTWIDANGTERPRIYFTGNQATGHIIVNFKQFAEYDPQDQYNNIWLDFTDSSYNAICDLLGITKNHRYASTFEAQDTLNLENDIQTVNIGCSLVSSSYFQGSANTDVIFSLIPQVPNGYMISVNPYQLIWLPINDTVINYIRIHIFDNLSRPIDMHGEPVTVTLLIRRRS